ncbi:hypothetical protein UW650_09375, partial [Streptococcus agalactiae]
QRDVENKSQGNVLERRQRDVENKSQVGQLIGKNPLLSKSTISLALYGSARINYYFRIKSCICYG